MTTRNLLISCVTAIILVLTVVIAVEATVTNDQRTRRDVRLACLHAGGSWVNGACLQLRQDRP